MQVRRLHLQNFRAVKFAGIEFDPSLTVIVGRNGMGKSSILDALAQLLIPLAKMWPTATRGAYLQAPEIPDSDIRVDATEAITDIEFSVRGIPQELVFGARRPPRDPNTYEPTVLSVWQAFQQTPPRYRPLFVYYRQDRGFDASAIHRSVALDRETMVSTSLTGDLLPITSLEAWWDRRDADEARKVRDQDSQYRDPQLEAIRSLITQIDGFTGITYSSSGPLAGLHFEKTGGMSIHVSKLSSGERSFIILLADLARRLQVLEPDKSLADIPGIVLIDEIELNLHPAWQSKIVSTLRHVFQSCQFIITTHSPQVLTAVESEHIRMLASDGDGVLSIEQPLNTKGRTSNYLLEGVFNAAERLPAIDDLIFKFNDAVDDGRFEEAEHLIEQIEDGIEGDAPEIMVLRTRLKRVKARQ
jgi:predicted ATP-binding protein involved in virulence